MPNPITNWFLKGQNTRIPNEAMASLGELVRDDWGQRQGISGPGGKGGWDPTRGFRVWDAKQGGFNSGPTPLGRQVVLRGLNAAQKFGSPLLVGSQLFGQGQEGSVLDQATEAMPDLQVGQLGISNNPETDIGQRSGDFIINQLGNAGEKFNEFGEGVREKVTDAPQWFLDEFKSRMPVN